MKKLFGSQSMGYAALAAVGLVGYVYWQSRQDVITVTKKAADAVEEVVKKGVNPVSHDNYANRAVNSVVQAITGDEHATLGTKIYDWLHGGG